MQASYGKTDLSEFDEPRTVVIWSSFMAGRNLEREILNSGQPLWAFKLKLEDTFLSKFNNPVALDVPGYSYMKEQHDRERAALKAFFNDKSITIEEYDKIAFEHHKRIKSEFLDAIASGNHELVMGYFNLADTIGHLSFGVTSKMRLIYDELSQLVGAVQARYDYPLLIISDHGMKPVGRFGDHSDYGFWASNVKLDLTTPKITEFADIITTVMKHKDAHKSDRT
jgi:hypothetical protein